MDLARLTVLLDTWKAAAMSIGGYHDVIPHWIQDDIAGQFQKVAFFLYQDCFVAALKHVPNKLVSAVEMLGIQAIKLTHTLR